MMLLLRVKRRQRLLSDFIHVMSGASSSSVLTKIIDKIVFRGNLSPYEGPRSVYAINPRPSTTSATPNRILLKV